MRLTRQRLLRDAAIITCSIVFAFILARYDLVAKLLVFGFVPIEAFIAGIFFTSLLTIAPAGVAFAEMAIVVPPMQLASWGAAGAVVGDLLLFVFVRDVISADLAVLLRSRWTRKLHALFHKSPFFSWAIPVAGAILIASPLPDEVGIAMLGLSKADIRFLVPISFAMNFLGIFLIGYAVGAS